MRVKLEIEAKKVEEKKYEIETEEGIEEVESISYEIEMKSWYFTIYNYVVIERKKLYEDEEWSEWKVAMDNRNRICFTDIDFDEVFKILKVLIKEKILNVEILLRLEKELVRELNKGEKIERLFKKIEVITEDNSITLYEKGGTNE